jgi:hypothetical protein
VNALLKKSLIVALAAASVPAVFGEPAKVAPPKPVPAKSVFVMPASARDGRDPFFPDSTRPYEENKPANSALDENSFSVKGLSVQNGHAMVIINNHTFAVGDEGDVLTSAGRVHLHLIDIRPNAVVIEVNGSRREINIGMK